MTLFILVLVVAFRALARCFITTTDREKQRLAWALFAALSAQSVAFLGMNVWGAARLVFLLNVALIAAVSDSYTVDVTDLDVEDADRKPLRPAGDMAATSKKDTLFCKRDAKHMAWHPLGDPCTNRRRNRCNHYVDQIPSSAVSKQPVRHNLVDKSLTSTRTRDDGRAVSKKADCAGSRVCTPQDRLILENELVRRLAAH